MKAYELIKIRRKPKNITPLESARLDLDMFKVNGLPSNESSQLVTFSLILSNFFFYLETGGQVYSRDYRIQNLTEIVEGFITVICGLTELIGLPEDNFDEMASAIAGGKDAVESGELSLAVKNASLSLQAQAWI